MLFSLLRFFLLISALAMPVFAYLFIDRNAPGLSGLPLLVGLATIYSLGFVAACWWLIRQCHQALLMQAQTKVAKTSSLGFRLLLTLSIVLIIYVVLDSIVLDYYQPVSLYDEVITSWVICWGMLVLSFVILIILANDLSKIARMAALQLSLLVGAGVVLVASMQYLNQAEATASVSLHQDVFAGGEEDVDIYRIPALLVLPAGSQLANGERLETDHLLAFAEARHDGALDTGVIDLVMKRSVDGGKSWSAQQRVCRYEKEGMQGKCGNATPVFDRDSGQIFLAYNLSGIPKAVHNRGHKSLIMRSDDGGESWGDAILVAEDNLVFGPGHGIQKQFSPNKGRLVIPAYLDHATVIYSDDHGQTWQRSEGMLTGNETEVAELSDGRIYMTTRHRAAIGRPPEPNGRLYSFSADGGESWTSPAVDQQLLTPVCQASVERYGDEGGLLFSNPHHKKSRVRMTLQYSLNNGEGWQSSVLVYPGPAGYSVLGVLSNGDVAVLYERGVMSYSERISLAVVKKAAFAQ